MGVNDKTVGTVREKLESTAEIPQLEKTTGRDGKARKASRAPVVRQSPADPVPDLVVNSNGPVAGAEKQPTGEKANDKIKANRFGVARAHEAINSLKRISKSDELRERGFQVVTDWIIHNEMMPPLELV